MGKFRQIFIKLMYQICVHALPASKRAYAYRLLGAKVGSGSDISRRVRIISEAWLVDIGNNVRLAEGVVLITHDGGLWTLRKAGMIDKRSDLFGRIKIGDNVHIGVNAIVMPGVTISENSVVGCGAIVTRNIDSGTVNAGVPSKAIRTIDAYMKKNQARFLMTRGLSTAQKRHETQSVV